MYDFLTFTAIFLFVGEIIIVLFCIMAKYGNKTIEIFSLGLLFKLLVTYGYYRYVETMQFDATNYYLYAVNTPFMLKALLVPGTSFINNLSALFYPMIKSFENKFLMLFIPFALIGFIGNLIFYRILAPLYKDKRNKFELYALCFFLPNLQFWTSNIGKDSIVFFGILLILYAVTLKKLNIVVILCLIVGMIITYLVRPHILLLLMVSFLLGLLLNNQRFSWKTIGLFSVLIIAFLVSYNSIFDFLDITIEDDASNKVNQYYETAVDKLDENAMNLPGGGASTGPRKFNLYYSPVYVASFLCSPFIWQARKPIQLVSALENIIYQFMILYLLWQWKLFPKLNIVQYKYGILIFIVIAGIILGMSQTNFGLTVRQKCMVLPFLILIFAAVRFYKRSAPIVEPVPLGSSEAIY